MGTGLTNKYLGLDMSKWIQAKEVLTNTIV